MRHGSPRRVRVVAIAAIVAAAAATMLVQTVAAHVGSPDVFVDATAGPYRVLVTVRPPHAIPGVADVEVLTRGDVREIRIAPLPLTGPAALFAPLPDVAVRSQDDPRLFTGHLWMMSAGAWQVRVTATGDRGRGVLSVPVPTLPQATLAMSPPVRAMLFVFMLTLCVGFVAIASAIGREAWLERGDTPGPAARRRGRIVGTIAVSVVVAGMTFGDLWWTAEASHYARYVYKPLQGTVALTDDGALTLTLRDPGWIATRRVDDFVPDHGHLMHLFVVSPNLDRLWHLHPTELRTGVFEQRLPAMPQGRYELFADLVHATGISETVTGELDTTAVRGAALTGDDSVYPAAVGADAPAVAAVSPVGATDAAAGTIAPLSDGGRMVWVRDAQPLSSKRLTMFTFRVEDRAGRPADDLELYMGMPGHAIFVRRDLRVFAHVHPSGSAPMAAMAIGERSLSGLPPPQQPPAHEGHATHGVGLPSTVSFPYGFPEAGIYRIFVQVKRGGRIETGAFDAQVP